MKPEIVEEIKHKYGDRANDSPFERNLYTRDLAPVPALMVDPLLKPCRTWWCVPPMKKRLLKY